MLTPLGRELDLRCAVMDRLRGLAQTGIAFCQGLDLEPYGEALKTSICNVFYFT